MSGGGGWEWRVEGEWGLLREHCATINFTFKTGEIVWFFLKFHFPKFHMKNAISLFFLQNFMKNMTITFDEQAKKKVSPLSKFL